MVSVTFERNKRLCVYVIGPRATMHLSPTEGLVSAPILYMVTEFVGDEGETDLSAGTLIWKIVEMILPRAQSEMTDQPILWLKRANQMTDRDVAQPEAEAMTGLAGPPALDRLRELVHAAEGY